MNPDYAFNERLLQINLLCSVIIAPMTYYECQARVEYLQYKKKLPKGATVFTSGMFKRLIGLVILSFVQPNQYFKSKLSHTMY